jgi:hypothetical protein
MSHFAQRFPDQTKQSFDRYAAFATRVNLGASARSSTASPVTATTAGFVVPVLGGSVTISVSSTTGFLVNDYVMVGTRGMYLTAPVHATSGPGTLAFTGRYFAGRSPSADLTPAGIALFGANGEYTTTTAPVPALPDWINVGGGSANISVADRAQVPSGGRVLATNYAGVYQVTSIPGATSLVLQYVIAGDLRPGDTCLVDGSGSDSGAAVAQFYILGTIPKGYIFCYEDAYLTCISSSGTNSTTPNISIGFVNSQYTSGPVTRFGEFVDNRGQQAGTVLTPNASMPVVGQEPATTDSRLTPMDGMTFGIRHNTPATTLSTNHLVDCCVRGWLFPMQ